MGSESSYHASSNGEVPEMENADDSGWEQSIEKLKERCTEFTERMFLAIKEEEARICREELEKSDDAHSRHCAPLNIKQRRGGWDG